MAKLLLGKEVTAALNAKLQARVEALKEKGITYTSTDAQVEKVLNEEVEAAVANSNEVVRSRIDRFGVVQPNIQQLDIAGRILIEMPGVKEPERMRKLLQGSANLEFWETYNSQEIRLVGSRVELYLSLFL